MESDELLIKEKMSVYGELSTISETVIGPSFFQLASTLGSAPYGSYLNISSIFNKFLLPANG